MADLARSLKQIGVTARASTGGEGSVVMELPNGADLKVRKGGEVTFRVRRGEEKFSLTAQSPDAAPAWQNAHHHKGYYERYIVLSGSIMIAYADEGGCHIAELYEYEEHSLGPTMDHNVRVFPGAVFLVEMYGGPAVPNPDKTGNDWWPASQDFMDWLASLPV